MQHKMLRFIQCQIDKLRPSSACWQDGFVEGGLDNTYTSYIHTNQLFNVTFDDDSKASFTIASATGWTDQVSQMAIGLDSVMPWAQTVEPFCNTAGGCGGLPEPRLELNQMVARYVGFRICHGGKVPVSVSYTSDQYPDPRELIIQYKESPITYLDRCFVCGEGETFYLRGTAEEYTPVCPAPCGTAYPDTPLVGCTNYPPVQACDNMGTADKSDDTPIVIMYQDCGNGLIANYMQTDTEGALVPYTLIGQPVDCTTGEVVQPPALDCQDFEIQKMFTLTTEPTQRLTNREWHDTAPTIPLSQASTEAGTSFRESHDFSLPTTVTSTQTTLLANDTSNVPSELDIQVLDGYLKVDRQVYIRYTGTAEGYIAIELGECGGPLQLKAEKGGFGFTTDSVLLKKGAHQIRIWNIDCGGSNSSFTHQYSYDNINWVSDNTPPDIELSENPIVEECVLVKICKPSGDMHDYNTNMLLNKADYYPCASLCTPDCNCSSSTNTHLIEGCVDVDGEAVSHYVIVDDKGNPITAAPIPLGDVGLKDCCDESEAQPQATYQASFKTSGVQEIVSDCGTWSGNYDFTSPLAPPQSSNDSGSQMQQAKNSIDAWLANNGGGTIHIEYLSQSVATFTVTGASCVMQTINDDSNPGPHPFTEV